MKCMKCGMDLKSEKIVYKTPKGELIEKSVNYCSLCDTEIVNMLQDKWFAFINCEDPLYFKELIEQLIQQMLANQLEGGLEVLAIFFTELIKLNVPIDYYERVASEKNWEKKLELFLDVPNFAKRLDFQDRELLIKTYTNASKKIAPTLPKIDLESLQNNLLDLLKDKPELLESAKKHGNFSSKEFEIIEKGLKGLSDEGIEKTIGSWALISVAFMKLGGLFDKKEVD